jgi:predicted nucleic acid-binding Zn ribbon protein
VDHAVKVEEEVIRKRQRERARIMAWLLGAFVVLMFLITIAKTGMNW